MNFGAKTRLRHSYFRGNRDGSLCFLLELLHRPFSGVSLGRTE